MVMVMAEDKVGLQPHATRNRRALVLYGSETGTAQDVAEELGRLVERLRFTAHVTELNTVPIDSISDFTIVIFAISTVGQGDLPANASDFWRSLLKKRLSSSYLRQVNFAVFGLGDSSYPKYIPFDFGPRPCWNRT